MKYAIQEHVLDNGLKLLIQESHALPVVCSTIWYRVGARDERTGETGLSHFLEHMMFKGTEKFAKGQIDLTTQRLGGHNNAFTDNDVTAYYFALASDRWQTALEIEQSRMRGCLLDAREFGTEKKVVLEELAMGEDDPDRALYHAVESAAFQVHPYHHPVIGWRQELEALDRERMVGYYQRHYAPDRAVMVIAGDVAAADTVRRVRELFEPIPSSGQPRPAPVAEPPQKGERRVRLHFPGNIPRLHLAFRGCRVGAPDDFALDVLQVVLAGGKASRLYRALVQGKELLSSISAYNEARLDPGLFWLMAELKSDSKLDVVEAELRKQLLRLRKEGVTAAELKRAHTLILSGFQFEQEAAMDMAMRIGRYECTSIDGHRLVPRYTEEILKVDRKRVQDVARRVLDDRVCTVGEVHPDGVG